MRQNSDRADYLSDGSPVAVDVLLNSDHPCEDVLAHVRDEPEFALEAPPDDDELFAAVPELAEEPPIPEKRERGAKGGRKPRNDRMSVYQALIDYGLLRKITDIVLAKVNVPWHLREDAAQEVHTTWAALVARPEFARNQLGRYAYMSGQHAALKLRRNIGAVVAIPGALFRTGRDTAFMEAIGAAVNPKDVDDYKDSLDLSVDPVEFSEPPQTVTPEQFRQRLSGLVLSKSQRAVAERVLVRRMSAESIARELDVRASYVERLIGQVIQLLHAKDEQNLGLIGPRRTPVGLVGPEEVPAAPASQKLRRGALK